MKFKCLRCGEYDMKKKIQFSKGDNFYEDGDALYECLSCGIRMIKHDAILGETE